MGRFTKFNQSVDKFGDGLLNWFRAKTGQGLSNAQLEANAFNASEAQKARDFNLQMYQDYESPKAMMEQYKAAGLNPALMYEGYTPAAVSSNATASSVAPNSEANFVTDGIQAMLGLISTKQQIDLQKAEIRSINADTEGKEIDNANKQEVYNWQFKLNEKTISELQSKIEKNKAEVNKIDQDIKESASRIDVNNKQIEIGDAQIELMGSEKELNETKAAINRLEAQKLEILLPYVQQYQEAQIALTNAQTQAEIAAAQKSFADAELSTAKALAENQLISEGYYHEFTIKTKRERKSITSNAIVGNIVKVIDSAAKVIDAVIPL